MPFECDVAWEGNDTHLAISPYTYQSYPVRRSMHSHPPNHGPMTDWLADPAFIHL